MYLHIIVLTFYYYINKSVIYNIIEKTQNKKTIFKKK